MDEIAALSKALVALHAVVGAMGVVVFFDQVRDGYVSVTLHAAMAARYRRLLGRSDALVVDELRDEPLQAVTAPYRWMLGTAAKVE